jgi:hypothetical protein
MEKKWLIGNCRDRPAYLAVRRKSDWQSDLHLAVRHGKSQRTKKVEVNSIFSHAGCIPRYKISKGVVA